jgi:hypothetical protein
VRIGGKITKKGLTKALPRSRQPRTSQGGHKRSAGGGRGRNGRPAPARRPGAGPEALRAPDSIARDLITAVVSSGAASGEAEGDERVHVTKAQARRVAVEFGGAMLEVTNLETAKHCDDVVVVSEALCEQLGVTGSEREDVLAAARLHDLGKAAVGAKVLDKAGPLDGRERELILRHTEFGERILAAVPELDEIARLVRHSHERWDGQGYPDGLAAEQIPLGSRIIFCADAFHAIRSDRPYRKGRSSAASLAEIRCCAGTQFDPRVVEAFEQVVRDLHLVPAKARMRRSSRLTVLLMMLTIGTGGAAAAGSGLLGEQASGRDGTVPPATGALQSLGIPVGNLVPLQRWRDSGFAPGSSPGAGAGSREGRPGQRGSSNPTGGSTGGGSGSGAGGSQGGGPPGSAPGNSANNPHGGPPGLSGGGPPGQSGAAGPGNSANNPQGGPPGQSGAAVPGNSADNPQGGPPGQSGGAKK